VVDVEDRPGVLADLARKVASAGVNLDLVYVATQNRMSSGQTICRLSGRRSTPRADEMPLERCLEEDLALDLPERIGREVRRR
jgi:ACT domain